ncbi:hypothetical protein FQN49_006575 [Arthroderma sp. PD_2]|nr:hypothetical protein FQN49_006575 [Arthroderma sp. PD_2]
MSTCLEGKFLHALVRWLIAIGTERTDLVVHVDSPKVSDTDVSTPTLAQIALAVETVERDEAAAGAVGWVVGVPFERRDFVVEASNPVTSAPGATWTPGSELRALGVLELESVQTPGVGG